MATTDPRLEARREPATERRFPGPGVATREFRPLYNPSRDSGAHRGAVRLPPTRTPTPTLTIVNSHPHLHRRCCGGRGAYCRAMPRTPPLCAQVPGYRVPRRRGRGRPRAGRGVAIVRVRYRSGPVRFCSAKRGACSIHLARLAGGADVDAVTTVLSEEGMRQH